MNQDYYDEFDDNYDDVDGFGEEYAGDDPEVPSAGYADEYSEDGEYTEDWPSAPTADATPARAYYSLTPRSQPEYSYQSGSARHSSSDERGGYFSGAPGPGCIAVATVLVCLSMALFLLRLASGIQLPQAAPIAAAVPAEPAAEQSGVLADETLLLSSEAANSPCQVSSLFPEKVLRWCGLISFYANQHSLSPDLIAALVWLESGGDEVAYSRSGAVGLMQVMPSDGLASTFMCVNGPCFSDRPTIAELQDPEFNIAWGTRFLAGLLRRHGDIRQALRSYGPMNVGFTYADKVLGLFERYKTPAPPP